MCGRYTFYEPKSLLEQYDLVQNEDLQLAFNMPDNYNVAPSHAMPVIIRGEQEDRLEFMNWGLIPSWSKSLDSSLKLINARRESLSEKRMWKSLTKSKRCIVPARGFYEWMTTKDGKHPYYMTLKKDDVLSFAGLWDEWHSPHGDIIKTFCIITTTPNKEMSAVHKRMPAILDAKAAKVWLSPITLSPEELDDVLQPIPDGSLDVVRVGTLVNSTSNNSRDLIYELD